MFNKVERAETGLSGADVVNAMGTEATKVLESTGLASFQDSSTERGLGVSTWEPLRDDKNSTYEQFICFE